MTRAPAIAAFALTPWILGGIHYAIAPDEPSEPSMKAAVLASRGAIDTAIVGDSRALRIGGEAFQSRGWNYANFAMSGLSPEDIALQLELALQRHPVKRVVIGVSFENLSELHPYEHSRYYADPVFAGVNLNAFAPPPAAPPPSLVEALSMRLHHVLPVGSASSTLRYYRNLRKRHGVPVAYFRPDGTAAYTNIEEQIASGTFDYAKQRDPLSYFKRNDSEARYLETKQLSPHGKELFRKMFARLRERGIPTVVVESGRTAAYQAMIDGDAVLRSLYSEWQLFLSDEEKGSVVLLSAEELRSLYDPNDFFDAAHYIGGQTEARVNERIAATLAALEKQ